MLNFQFKHSWQRSLRLYPYNYPLFCLWGKICMSPYPMHNIGKDYECLTFAHFCTGLSSCASLYWLSSTCCSAFGYLRSGWGHKGGWAHLPCGKARLQPGLSRPPWQNSQQLCCPHSNFAHDQREWFFPLCCKMWDLAFVMSAGKDQENRRYKMPHLLSTSFDNDSSK